MTNRPSWDDIYKQFAVTISQRSTCSRGQVGCVVTRRNRPLVIAYNGSAPDSPHCTDVGCDIYWTAEYEDQGKLSPHCSRAIHAEQNVFGQATSEGINLNDTTWYFYPFGPCRACQNLMLTLRINRVVVFLKENSHDHNEYESAKILRNAGVKVEIIHV